MHADVGRAVAAEHAGLDRNDGGREQAGNKEGGFHGKDGCADPKKAGVGSR